MESQKVAARKNIQLINILRMKRCRAMFYISRVPGPKKVIVATLTNFSFSLYWLTAIFPLLPCIPSVPHEAPEIYSYLQYLPAIRPWLFPSWQWRYLFPHPRCSYTFSYWKTPRCCGVKCQGIDWPNLSVQRSYSPMLSVAQFLQKIYLWILAFFHYRLSCQEALLRCLLRV